MMMGKKMGKEMRKIEKEIEKMETRDWKEN